MTNKDVVAATGSLGAVSVSLQTHSSSSGSEDGVVTVFCGRRDRGKLDGLVERITKNFESDENDGLKPTKGTKGRGEKEEPAADDRADLVCFAWQVPSSLENIIDFDVHCR